MSYNNVQGLDLSTIKKDLSFQVNLEKVFTQEDDRVSKNAVTRFSPDGKKILGLVSPRRRVIPYSEMMDWVVGELDHSGMDYKLIESTLVTKQDNLFQQYLFDTPIPNPDGQEISPMIVLKGSHVGTPLRVDIGTYRFVCANGALVGNTIKSIQLRANDLDGLRVYALRDSIRSGIDSMTEVSRRYTVLADEGMETYMFEMFNSPVVPVALKKAMFDFWQADGTLNVLTERTLKNDSFLTMSLDGNMIVDYGKDNVAEILEPKSAWTLYNDATEVATHSARNVTAQNMYFNAISKVFSA